MAKSARKRGPTKPGKDVLDEMRAQLAKARIRSGDVEFVEFVWGMTIIDQLIEREFKRYVTSEFDLSPGDVRILLALRRAAPSYSLRPTDLFKNLLVTSGAITKQVDRLEKRGLVRRHFNEEHRRGWLVMLSEEGLRVANSTFGSKAATPITHAAFHSLSKTQRADVLRLMHLLVREIEQHVTASPID